MFRWLFTCILCCHHYTILIYWISIQFNLYELVFDYTYMQSHMCYMPVKDMCYCYQLIVVSGLNTIRVSYKTCVYTSSYQFTKTQKYQSKRNIQLLEHTINIRITRTIIVGSVLTVLYSTVPYSTVLYSTVYWFGINRYLE